MFRILASAACAACFLVTTATAQIEDGGISAAFADAYAEASEARGACLEQDFDRCFDLALPLAEAGNPVAQNLVGIVHSGAQGDGAEAVYWMTRAAAQGYGKASYNLADFFEEDRPGFGPNIALAIAHYQAAADQGYLRAYEALGWRLLFGEEAHQNHARGLEVLAAARAADPDNPYYDSLLADAYYFGTGVEVDYARALELYESVAATGSAYARYSAGYQYYFGEGTEVDDARAVEYFQLAVDDGHPGAHGYLAEAYYYGYGLEPDLALAFDLARRGDELGDDLSSEIGGYMLLHGEGVAQDFVAARAMLERGVERGNADALYHLGDMAYFGYGQEVDFEQAFSVFQQVLEIEPDHGNANYSTGFMMMRGEGTDRDLAGSVPFIHAGVEAGIVDAAMEIPVLYGHPEFAGDHSDPVAAMGYCIYLTDEGHLTDPETQEDTFAACAHLQSTLSMSEMLEAAAKADDLKR